jgi:radical SAM superfamily enzyme YgiQ (UPF0313 family)
MRVLLINPPSPERLGAPLLGLQYVAASLLDRGCEVQVIDAASRCLDQDAETVLVAAEAFAPHIVGFSLFTRWVRHAYAFVQHFAGRFPLLVAGGAHPTVRPDEVLQHGFDIAVIGEAEETMLQIIDWVEGRIHPGSVCGIRFRSPDGRFCNGRRRGFLEDLNRLPSPLTSQHLFNPRWYNTSGQTITPGGILTSRGCPARCTFCANYVTGRRFRARSAGSIIEELNGYHALCGANFFPFWDDAFTADHPRVLRLCEALQRDIQFDLHWSAVTQARMVTLELLAAMKRSGCSHLVLGVESGDNEILRAIGKRITTGQVVRTLEMAKSLGFSVTCNFMLGFPGETPQALERTLRFMEGISPMVDSFSTLGVLVPFPGTPLYENHHREFGFTDWWLREDAGRHVPAAGMEDREGFHRQYCDDANLDLDFFRYSEETRQAIRACLKFKAEHNLRRMGWSLAGTE